MVGKNLIKKIDKKIRRIPDFYEPEDSPGRRDCIKGLISLTGGVIGLMAQPIIINDERALDVALSLAAAETVLFFGYIGKGIYKTIKSELNGYEAILN